MGTPARNSESDAPRDVDLTRDTQRIWDAKADYWDERMGEGNAFHRELVGPATERLLAVQPEELILDVACGNGQLARRLAQLGARVVATDFSQRFLDRARARATDRADLSDRVEYRLVDATDERQLLALGERRFDAAVCGMALMDMTTIEPLLGALARLLRPGGRFVFSVPHPCFNLNGMRMSIEVEDRGGELVTTRWVKVSDYLRVPPGKGAGMPGEPVPHWYFHRPLSELFTACFRRGFVMDGIEEPAFPDSAAGGSPLSWFNYTNIPPVLVARMRLP